MKSILYLLMFMLLIGSASAIMLSSPPYQPNPKLYEPGMVIDLNFKILEYAYDGEPFLGGILSSYATITNIVDHGDYKTFRVILTPPDNLTGGTHTLYVGGQEIADPSRSGVIGLAKAQKRIMIRVLYDEKWVVFDGLNTPNMNENEIRNFSIKATSLSKQYISGLWGEIKIYDFNNKLIKTLKIDNFNLPSAAEETVFTEFDSTGITPGKFTAKAEMHWANNITTLENKFNIGILDLTILNVSGNFSAGQINRLFIDIENKWNGDVNNIYAQLFVNGEEQVATQTYSLKPFEKKTMMGFLDLEFVGKGAHNLTVILHYEGEQETIEKEINVIGKAKRKPINWPELNSLTMIIGLSVIVAILLIVIGIIEFKRKK